MRVDLTLTPDAGLLPAVEAAVSVLATQMGFTESRRRMLAQGVEQACRRALAGWPSGNHDLLTLSFIRFADRLEIVVEDGEAKAQEADADAFLLTQLVDRVTFEETETGRARVTLVQYISHAGGQQ